MPVALTADLIESFGGTFISPKYDQLCPTPPFHRECWALYASTEPAVEVVAPRDHAKSSALTMVYILAECLFRTSDYVILIGSTEDGAAEQLGNITEELAENEDLIREFGVKRFLRTSTTDIIVEMNDGYRFRVLARGAEQRIRGRLWKGKRPNLLVCHKKGTVIEDAGVEMLVEDHPTAQIVQREGFGLYIHGLPKQETVTPEHQYWIKKIRQKKCAEYKAGVKVRNYTEYIQGKAVWQEAWTLDNTCWLGLPIDYIQKPAPETLELFFCGDFWWMLGLWWGDGTCNGSQVAWYVADKDVSTAERIRKYCSFIGAHVSVSQRVGCSSFTITHKQLAGWLKTWSYGNSLKKAPSWVLQLPLEQQAAIVKGYIAADGFVDLKNQQVRLTSVCYPALLQVRKMLARLGVVSTIRQGKVGGTAVIQGRIVSTQTKYDLRFRDGASTLGFNITDSERYELKRVFIAEGFLWSQVHRKFAMTPQEFVPVQTESHTYLTDFGLSHNCDDMEDDEQVENPERRRKFRIWFFRAAKQALSKSGKIRVHGTILHDDSLLSRLRRNKSWKHLFYAAHTSFDDFSNPLWPERWSEDQLRARRQEFIEDGDSAGYSQEFLNNPLDHSDAFLKIEDFRPMSLEDYETDKVVCAAADFAVSKADRANRTAFVVGGKDVNNLLHHIDFRAGRWDTMEWIEQLFKIQAEFNPEVFWVEDGVIWKAVKSMIYREMQVRDTRINFEAILPVRDKGTRGRPFQRRMRAGQCRFDKKHENYHGFEQETLRFTGSAAATLDDYFDAGALLSRGFDEFAHLDPEDFFSDDEHEMERGFWNSRPARGMASGRSRVTGY